MGAMKASMLMTNRGDITFCVPWEWIRWWNALLQILSEYGSGRICQVNFDRAAAQPQL